MFQEIWQAVLLGIVQGIGEFLPISSKGHLLLVQELLSRYAGRELGEPLEMVVALHLGTLFSIVVVYWKDLLKLLRQPKLCAWIVLATIPVGLVGITLKKYIEHAFQAPLYTGCGLLVTALILWISEKFEAREDRSIDDLDKMQAKQAILVGLFQCFALLPGISRSGTTIAGGLFAGLRREAAARFSFFIAIPAISAASLLTFKDVLERGQTSESVTALLVGAITAFVIGVASLRWLIRLVVQRRLHWFSYYCVVVGVATIIWSLTLPPKALKLETPEAEVAAFSELISAIVQAP